MPSETPLSSDVRICRRGRLYVLLCVLRVVDTEVFEPALDLVERLVDLRRDVARMGGDAAEDEAEDEHPDGNEPEQDEDRAADTRNAMALQPADRGSGDRADHGGEDDRHDDRRRLAEQPHEPDDDQHKANEQPRRDAELHEPRRRGKPDGPLGRHRSRFERRRQTPARGGYCGRCRRTTTCWPTSPRSWSACGCSRSCGSATGRQLLSRVGGGSGGARPGRRLWSPGLASDPQRVGRPLRPGRGRRRRRAHAQSRSFVSGGEEIANVELVVDDLFDSKLEPQSFDLVHARYLIAPLGRGREQVASHRRLVKPGGSLVLEEWDLASWHFNPTAPAAERLIRLLAEIFAGLGGEAGRGLPSCSAKSASRSRGSTPT